VNLEVRDVSENNNESDLDGRTGNVRVFKFERLRVGP
jgi:hypothetical protein